MKLLNHTTPLNLCSYPWPFRTFMILVNRLNNTLINKNILDEIVSNITEAFKTAGFVEVFIIKFRALH